MTLRGKLSFGFGLAVALLLAVGAVSLRSVQSSEEHNRLVALTYEVLETLQSVHLLLTEAESASRGFQITSEQRYLEKYYSGLSMLRQDLPLLHRLLADNPDQQRRLALLAPIIERRLNLLAEAVELHKDAPADIASQLQFTARGKKLMDQIRLAIAEMKAEEHQLLSGRSKAAAASARQTFLVVVGGTSLALALALIGGLLLHREMAVRQRAEVRFRTLLEAAPDSMIIVDSQGCINLVNAQTELLFGYPRAELIGRPVETLIPERFHESHVTHRGGFFTNPQTRPMGAGLELFARRKDGSEFPVEISLSPFHAPDGTFVTAAARDITDRKRTADDLIRLHHDLQRRAAELEASNKELETFTYSVSHDLRAPLRHIDGFSRILLDDHGASLDPEARRFLNLIRDSTQHMGRLVDDLLDFSRVSRQEIRPQIAGLGTLLEEVLTGLLPELGDRTIEWQIGKLPIVECDPGLVRQALDNLLSNAVKYTRPRNPAVISVGVMDSSDPPVIFVRDNGVGFSMKYADKLFGVFQRLHRSDEFEGTGVSLATVQRIIHKHGGRIWAEAELDGGATFFFTLGSGRPQRTREKILQRGVS